MQSLIGLIEIGSPGQTIDVQFDTTFNGTLIQSTYEGAVISGSPVYNSSDSTSVNEIISENYGVPLFLYTFADSAEATAIAGSETFNIGGVLYSDIAFGQLWEYDLKKSGRIMPFGGASGVIGLNPYPWQPPDSPNFMYAIRNQLTEWKCSFDLYRAWKNGTLTFGALENPNNRADIAWAERNANQPTWSINITAISAGSRKNPPIATWSATISTEEQSLVWPQKLLDWYFTGVGATWSAAKNTYRYPCNATLPDFTFGFGNGTFTIPGAYLPYQRDQTGTTCVTIITGDNSTDSDYEYSFGSWWSQLGVLILDYEHSQVGFMNKSTPLPAFGISSLESVVMG
ncbi:endothiapepsin precursor, putative [Talaromyces stipitatus ATCC 10500]|uniref:Endothiapepsin, putative n=1 Tax=Talaromyces stipitatus (strain ATCC 10500 / CBS 375.48 / QM 6759 / NRRL 1006) TaxID=441959 RepID=B8LU67_TALSN|nr:endothiapepsin precursor, putative [Talaromyces stipitatus ATCC 10500]EED22539.1 endothiapepsin precursor, putative [Talaromyces stipitatus ATCC 10500]